MASCQNRQRIDLCPLSPFDSSHLAFGKSLNLGLLNPALLSQCGNGLSKPNVIQQSFPFLFLTPRLIFQAANSVEVDMDIALRPVELTAFAGDGK